MLASTVANTRIVSQFSIKSFGVNIPINLFEESELSSLLTKITIQTNNYCYLFSNSSIDILCIAPFDESTSLKNNTAIFLVNNEDLLFTLIDLELSLPQFSFQIKAILFPSRIASKNIHQSLSTPLFIIEQKEFDLLLDMITTSNKSKVITEENNNDFVIEIQYDNTNSLMPYNYISYSKYFPFIITSISTIIIIIQFISLNCNLLNNQKLFIVLSILKYLFSIFYFLWLNLLLSTNSNGTLTQLALQCVFDVLMSIIYSIYLTIHFSFIIISSFGFGILYFSFTRDQIQIYFLLFVMLYLFISSDSLVDYIDYKLFGSIKMSEMKNIIVILIICSVCFIKIRVNMNLLKEKIRYSIEYAHHYYYWFKAKHRIMQLLGLIIVSYALGYCSGMILLHRDRVMSPYYEVIKKVNVVNIGEVFYLLSSIVVLSKERVLLYIGTGNSMTLTPKLRGNVFKCVVKSNNADIYDNSNNVVLKKETNKQVIIALPGFETHTRKDQLIDLDSLKLGTICV